MAYSETRVAEMAKEEGARDEKETGGRERRG